MWYRSVNLQTLHFKYLFNKYTYWIFYTCCTISVFFSSKCRLFHNATLFGSCIIRILPTGGAKIVSVKFRLQKVKSRNLFGQSISTGIPSTSWTSVLFLTSTITVRWYLFRLPPVFRLYHLDFGQYFLHSQIYYLALHLYLCCIGRL